jgi:ABC-type sugar transport system ATPase subunit
MASVELRGVAKRFGVHVAVEPLSLVVPDRSFVSLVGPSGCGKTTTLRMVAGLETPSEGAILFDADRVEHLSANQRDIAMVFQSYALYPHMSVRENIAFPLRMMKVPERTISQRVELAARRLAIADLMERRPRELSGGQRQRVALGRAIVREPAVFLMDEPLSNLDAQLRVEMRAELRRLHLELQRTILYVTHDQAEALTMSDMIAVMNRGVLQQYGTPDQIYHRPSNLFVAGFIGSPAMNFVPGRIEPIGGAAMRFIDRDEAIDLPLGPTGLMAGEVVLGVRPEAVALEPGLTRHPVQGHVYVVEPLGADLFVTVKLSQHLLKLRTTAEQRYRAGDAITVHLDRRHLYLFDAASGRRMHPADDVP